MNGNEAPFDYGGTAAEADVNFKIWPSTGMRTGLVDADLLPYRTAFVMPDIKGMQAVSLVENGHCKSIKETPQFEYALDSMCMTLNSWLRAAKCDSAILYSTNSASNFRLKIAYSKEYKGSRPTEKPVFFDELKDALPELGCIASNGNEADDMLSIEAWRRYNEDVKPSGALAGSLVHKEFCSTVTISTDKDSTITPTYNYNPDTRKEQWVTLIGDLIPKYKKGEVTKYKQVGTGVFFKKGEFAGQEKTKRVKDGTTPSTAITDLKGSGLKFFYAQLIMGDPTDGYDGIPNKGATAAFNELAPCTTESDLYYKVLKMYQEHYGKGTHWCENYRGTEEYRVKHFNETGSNPPDWDFWKGKGAYLTAYDRMLEQGRMAHMQIFDGEIWRSHSGRVIYGDDKEFWHGR